MIYGKFDEKIKEHSYPMKSDYPFNTPPAKNDEMGTPPSRFIDEKIADESCTETNSENTFAPTGLNNPFWN